jgi:hypothetical protein
MFHDSRNATATRKLTQLVAMLLATAWLLPRSATAVAATPSAETRSEVMHLLAFVQQSTCEFNRNDTWHSGLEARQHLEMKYDSLVIRGSISKAEDFVDKAASNSSLSGRDYQIRCRNGKTISSSQWLSAELRRYRKGDKAN